MNYSWRPLVDKTGTARARLESNLDLGREESSLTRRVLNRIQGVEFRLFALSVTPIDESAIVDYRHALFGRGEFAANVSAGTPDPFITFVEAYLLSVERGVVVLPNACFRASHECVRRYQSAIRFVGEDVYHPLLIDDVGTDRVECALAEANNAYWFCALCAEKVNVSPGETWTSHFLDEIADKTTHIITEAFDGEGYLVGTPVSRIHGECDSTTVARRR